MPKVEQAQKVSVRMSEKGPLKLSMNLEGKNRGLTIENSEYLAGLPDSAEELLKTLMLAHLVATSFPQTIETNFNVEWKVVLDELYRYYDYSPAEIVASPSGCVPVGQRYSQVESPETIDVANAHSGGLDSAYRLAKLLAERQKPMVVHLRNLNGRVSYKEAEASRIQADAWGVSNREVQLVNSSKNSGPDTMRTRDLLLAMITMAMTHAERPKFVEVEGGWLADETAHFSEHVETWEMFNKILREAGLETQMRGVDPGDVETVGELLKLERELGLPILDLIQNCMSDPNTQLPTIRRRWEREAPTIAAASSERWCGSCIKCRRMTLGRLFYGDSKFGDVESKEVDFFKNDTRRWMEKYPKHADLISASFLTHLERLAR